MSKISPLHVDFCVAITGTSAFFGTQAFQKSKELAAFIESLKSITIAENQISLDNVTLHKTKGSVLSTSSVEYLVGIRKCPLEKIPEILSVIASQNTIELKKISYIFDDQNVIKKQMIQQTALQSKQQAIDLCAALHVDLIGIHAMIPLWSEPDQSASYDFHETGFLSRSRHTLPGLEITDNYTENLILTLRTEYKIGEFKI